MLRRIRSGFLGNDAGYRRHSDAPPRPTSPLEFDDGMDPTGLNYVNSTMEALSLEPVVAPSLAPMRPLVISPEGAMHRGRKRPNLSMGDHMREEMDRRPSALLVQASRAMGMALLPTAVPVDSPKEEIGNPFDSEANPFVITSIPRRPEIRRNAVSARTRRDMPLRVQALRRSHQQAFAEAIAARVLSDQAAWARRTSDGSDYGDEGADFVPSALWGRRQRGGPDDDAGAVPRIHMHGQNVLQGASIFSQVDDAGNTVPYSFETPVRDDTPSPPQVVDPIARPTTPRGSIVLYDMHGRPYI